MLQENLLTRGLLSTEFEKRLRYVPLLSAGMLVFLGIVFLGGLSGLRWHSRTFGWLVTLNPTLLGPTGDWIVWGFSLLVSLFPAVAAIAIKRTARNLVHFIACLFLVGSSLVAMTSSYVLGATLLVVSGFLIACALVLTSTRLLGVDIGSAARVVCSVVFALLALVAAGGFVSILLWQKEVFLALASTPVPNLSYPSMIMFAVDLEVFYLARPFLLAIFVALAAAAFVALFKEPFQSIVQPITRRLTKKKGAGEHLASSMSGPQTRAIALRACFPYVILAGSIALGIAITVYSYLVANVSFVLGSDAWFYLHQVYSMRTLADVVPLLQGDRGFFLLLLFLLKTATGLSPDWVVKLTPGLLSALLAVSSFVLVREGTGKPWLAAFAALLSVVSAQTSLGMGAFIITNWFALSLANFTFTLLLRAIRLRSKLAAGGSLTFSLVLLASYAFLWVVVIAELALVLFASIVVFRYVQRRELKYEVGFIGGVLLSAVLIPIAFLFFAATPLLGFRPQGLDPIAWITMGWSQLTQGATGSEVLSSGLAALEATFDFAGNRVDLPFLTLLSVIGLLDGASETRSFRRIIAVTVLVPLGLTLITRDIYFTWRGLYIIPLYLTGALGAESVIRRVNGQESLWKSRSRLVFAGTFSAYLFISLLAYSFRALELLIMVAGG